jgi:hypothetical protein
MIIAGLILTIVIYHCGLLTLLLLLMIVISIRVINQKKGFFHADDLKRFESLNSSIMSYGINEL